MEDHEARIERARERTRRLLPNTPPDSLTGNAGYAGALERELEFAAQQLEEAGLPDHIADEVRNALEGDSNDAEHDALVTIADHFGINWRSPYE